MIGNFRKRSGKPDLMGLISMELTSALLSVTDPPVTALPVTDPPVTAPLVYGLTFPSFISPLDVSLFDENCSSTALLPGGSLPS